MKKRILQSLDWMIEPAQESKMKLISDDGKNLSFKIKSKGTFFGIECPAGSQIKLRLVDPKGIVIESGSADKSQFFKAADLEFGRAVVIDPKSKQLEGITYSSQDVKVGRTFKGYKVRDAMVVILNPHVQKNVSERTKIAMYDFILHAFEVISENEFSAELTLLQDQKMKDLEVPKHSRISYSKGKISKIVSPEGKSLYSINF